MMTSNYKLRNLIIQLGIRVPELAIAAKISQQEITNICKGLEVKDSTCIKIVETINHYYNTKYQVEDIFEKQIQKQPLPSSLLVKTVIRCNIH